MFCRSLLRFFKMLPTGERPFALSSTSDVSSDGVAGRLPSDRELEVATSAALLRLELRRDGLSDCVNRDEPLTAGVGRGGSDLSEPVGTGGFRDSAPATP